jgi:hypothetical protein
MTNMDQKSPMKMDNNDKQSVAGDVVKMSAEIKKTWNKLTDAEIVMYDKQPDAFFDALKTKHSVAKEDAMKKLKELKTNCGCNNATKAA